MFGFGKVEQVVPLSFKDGLLLFRSNGKLKPGKNAKLALVLAYGEKIHSPRVSASIIEVEPELDGSFLCTGALAVSPSQLTELTMQLAYAGVAGADRRGTKRLTSTTRILSRELANFRGVTTNINGTGAELSCDGPVGVETTLNLRLDMESSGDQELEIQASCVWCLEVGDAGRQKKYRVGVVLCDGRPEKWAAWDVFYRARLATEGASVMLKTMDGGSITDRPAKDDSGGHPRPQASPRAADVRAPEPPTRAAPPSDFGGPRFASTSGAWPQMQPPEKHQAWQTAAPTSWPAPAPPVFGAFAGDPADDGSGVFSPPPWPPSADFRLASVTPYAQQAAPPVLVEPICIEGPDLIFRSRDTHGFAPGASRSLQLSFHVDGRAIVVDIQVQISRIDVGFGGVCVCWCRVLEDAAKLQVLNQLI